MQAPRERESVAHTDYWHRQDGVSGQRYASAELYPWERTPGTHWIGGCLDLRAGLDTEGRGNVICLGRGSNRGCPVCIQTLDRTELPQFPYVIVRIVNYCSIWLPWILRDFSMWRVFLSAVHRSWFPVLSHVVSLVFQHLHKFWLPRCCFSATNKWIGMWEATMPYKMAFKEMR
jgi:hypothetical protein